MYRKHLVAASTLAVVALLAAACTLPAPAERNWKVSPTSVKVIDQEDFDPGDEGAVTFDEVGDFPYYCSLHGTPTKGMIGGIRVVE